MSFVRRFALVALLILLAIFFVPSARALVPISQQFLTSDLAVAPVSEINPAWSAFGSCVIAAALILRHSAKFRK